LPAADFGPTKLETVRQRMILAGVSRNVINQRVGRIKRMFCWAVSKEHVPANVHHALVTGKGLQQGRTNAPEPLPIEPVPPGDVDATLPVLSPTVASMVKVQLMTGCRPGEICGMTATEIDRSGPIWIYRPAQHKTAWRGKKREIAIGPKAQEVLQP